MTVQYCLVVALLQLICHSQIHDAHLHHLRIGALLDQSNKTLAKIVHGAVDLAVRSINEDMAFKNLFALDYVIGESGCTGEKSTGEFARLKYRHQVDAIVGPSCDEGCKAGGFLATYHNVPMLSHSCSTSQMSDKVKYPTFGRLKAYASASPFTTTNALVMFFGNMNWKKIGIIHGNGEKWSSAASAIKYGLQKAKIEIAVSAEYLFGHTASSAHASMQAVKRLDVRSKWLCFCVFIFTAVVK